MLSSESGLGWARSDLGLEFRFNRQALIELEDAGAEYESESRGLGLRFLDSVKYAIEQICDYPELAPVLRRLIRRKVILDFPYSILYRINPGHVRILAVAHHRRQPFYWLQRS